LSNLAPKCQQLQKAGCKTALLYFEQEISQWRGWLMVWPAL